MKKIGFITVVMFSAVLTACSPKDTTGPASDMGMTIQITEDTGAEKEEIPTAEKEEIPVTETEEIVKETGEVEKTENLAESPTEPETEGVYEDNFAVETDVAKAFAEKIQAAVTAKDIEALADLTAFPVYVGIAGGGVEDRETFIALGADKVFTAELIESVEGADISNLSPSMAGFSISKDGKANIIFGVVEGRLAISGINYE